MKFLANLDLIYLLVSRDLKVRYKNSFFGYIWAIANPLAFAVIYYFAFKVILRIEVENYSSYLLIGLFTWIWVSNSLIVTSVAFRGNISLIRTTKIKPYLLVFSGVMNEMVHFLFAIPVLILVLLYSEQSLYLSWLWQLPVLIILQAILLTPLGIILSSFNIVFRDIEYLVGIAMTMLFFLTPIVYPINLVPDSYQAIYHVNPFVYLIDVWHKVLLNGYIPMLSMAYLLIFSFITSIISYGLYSKNIRKAAEYL
mgnify:FL=1